MTTLQCPVCHSVDIRRTGEDHRCNRCDTLFRITDEGPVVRIAGTPPPSASPARTLDPERRQSSASLWLGAGIVAFVVLLVALLVLWTLPNEDDGPQARPAAEVTKDLLDRNARKEAPEVSLRYQRRGVTESGQTYWLVTYANEDSIPVRRPSVAVTLFDEQGEIVGRTVGRSPLPELGPGDETVIFVEAGVQDFRRAEVKAETPVHSRRPPRLKQLGGELAKVVGTAPDRKVTGTLRNLHDKPVVVAQVDVIGRDLEGSPTAWATMKVDDMTLEPGATSTVDVPLGEHILAEPAYWTILATGMPQK